MEETSSDFKVFGANPSNSSNQEAISSANETPPMRFDREAVYYDMTGDKYLIIFNHHSFKKTKYFQHHQPSTRGGTFEDVKSLQDLFQGLTYDVTIHTDLVYTDVLNEVAKFCKKDHSRTSCVIITILTHGDSNSEVFASDRPYKISDITNMVENTDQLVGKPKIFFIQACRGPEMDEGKTVSLDGAGRAVLRLPTHADFLFLHSSVDGYLSYRDSRGSWLIQTLCELVRKNHEDLDILHIITMTHKYIAYEKSTYTPRNQDTNNKKQMTEARYTLTKLFRF